MSTPARSTRRTTRSAAWDGHGDEQPPVEGSVPPVARKQAKRNGGSGGSGPSGSPAYVLLALVLIAGGITYNRWAARQEAAAAARSAGDDAPHRSVLEQEAPGDAATPAPPLPKMTAEEIAIFEKATEEHYGLPPGYQMPEFVAEELPPPVNYDEAYDGAAAEDPQDDAHAAAMARATAHEDAMAQVQGEAAGGEGQEGAEPARQLSERRASSNADEEGAAAAAATFDADVHRAYLELPAWPHAEEQTLKGGWDFSEQIYNYGASLPATQVLSWENPRLVLFPSFLSPEEVRHMIRVSKDNLERSEVLVNEGEDTQSNIRTSFGFWPESDEVVDAIQERIHRAIGVPQNFGEGLYVLNYQRDQKYEAHNDHCMDGYGNGVAEPACLEFLRRAGGPECGPGRGGPTCGDRVATFILYLRSPAKGGKTAFPEADLTKQAMGGEHRPGASADEWYCSDDRVLAASPNPGTGVLFWDYRPSNGSGTGSYQDGSAQPYAQTVYAAMHAGCPVLEGEKWIATRWIRSSRFI